jgi:hypothetical protein
LLRERCSLASLAMALSALERSTSYSRHVASGKLAFQLCPLASPSYSCFLALQNALDFPDINLFEIEAINFALYAWGYMGIFHLSLSSQIKKASELGLLKQTLQFPPLQQALLLAVAFDILLKPISYGYIKALHFQVPIFSRTHFLWNGPVIPSTFP